MFRKKIQPKVNVVWLIAGLGNPGSEYAGTRHNVGFEVIERLAKKHGIKLDKSKHRSRFGIGTIAGNGVVIVKPMTYMNLSGQALKPLLLEFGLEPSKLLVIADETDLPLGRIRVRDSGGAGGHNGHKSIIGSLGLKAYPRIRLGIGRVDKDETIDHVLGRFEPEESLEAHRMLDQAVLAVELCIEHGIERAMNETNGSTKEP